MPASSRRPCAWQAVMPRRRRALLCAALLALAPLAARADFVDDYFAGLAALDHGEYARAVQSLDKALQAQPNPVTQVRINGIQQPYLPHHFLGMAHLRMGDCAAAGKEWNSAMNLRMIGRLRPIRNQEEELLAQCKPGSTSAPAPASPAPGAQAGDQPASSTVTPAPSAPASSAAPAGPPASLLRAYDDFVNARYSSVLRLDADSLDGDRARFQAHLLRSAARFCLSRLGGDKSQLEAARREARDARALQKTAPPADVFSPAFRAFYAEAR